MSPQVAPQVAATVPTAFTVGYRAPQKANHGNKKKRPNQGYVKKKKYLCKVKRHFNIYEIIKKTISYW